MILTLDNNAVTKTTERAGFFCSTLLLLKEGLDFSKAVDFVSNGCLLRKLHHQAEHPPVDHILPSWQNPEIGRQGNVFRQCASRQLGPARLSSGALA